MNLAQKIKQARERAGMTQKEAACSMGISQQAYSQYESGRRTPKPETLKRIADAFGIQFSELFGVMPTKGEKYQEALDQAIKDAMQRTGEIDHKQFLKKLREYNAGVTYGPLETLREKTDALYQEMLNGFSDSELKDIAFLSFESLNRVGKIEAIKRLSELEMLPRYSSWSKYIGFDQEEDDRLVEHLLETATLFDQDPIKKDPTEE